MRASAYMTSWIPTSSAPMAAHLVLTWIHQLFSNLKGWAALNLSRAQPAGNTVQALSRRVRLTRTQPGTRTRSSPPSSSLFAIAMARPSCLLQHVPGCDRNKVQKRFTAGYQRSTSGLPLRHFNRLGLAHWLRVCHGVAPDSVGLQKILQPEFHGLAPRAAPKAASLRRHNFKGSRTSFALLSKKRICPYSSAC